MKKSNIEFQNHFDDLSQTNSANQDSFNQLANQIFNIYNKDELLNDIPNQSPKAFSRPNPVHMTNLADTRLSQQMHNLHTANTARNSPTQRNQTTQLNENVPKNIIRVFRNSMMERPGGNFRLQQQVNASEAC